MKKRDLSDVELREILCELLPLVRVDHVLPPNSDVLSQVRGYSKHLFTAEQQSINWYLSYYLQAIRRGLVSTPPSHMIGDDRHSISALRLDAWVRGTRTNGLFVRPRLFMPYYEESKVSFFSV